MEFSFLTQYMNYVEQRQDKLLVLFGAGDKALHLLRDIFSHDDIYAIWDNNPEKQGKKMGGTELLVSKTCANGFS